MMEGLEPCSSGNCLFGEGDEQRYPEHNNLLGGAPRLQTGTQASLTAHHIKPGCS